MLTTVMSTQEILTLYMKLKRLERDRNQALKLQWKSGENFYFDIEVKELDSKRNHTEVQFTGYIVKFV